MPWGNAFGATTVGPVLEPDRLLAALENGAPALPPVISPHDVVVAAAGTWVEAGRPVPEELRLTVVPAGVGKAIAAKVREYLDTGRVAKLEELRAEVAAAVLPRA